jgi:hypothetical protein
MRTEQLSLPMKNLRKSTKISSYFPPTGENLFTNKSKSKAEDIKNKILHEFEYVPKINKNGKPSKSSYI